MSVYLLSKMRSNIVIPSQYMRTSAPDIYAAGDVVSFPLFLRGDEQINIAHWQMAHAHGKQQAPTSVNVAL